jgi:2-polyprenyl-3-methyl-5-hydroxy-6-metoxy-1,4-benzoquinol methylase
VRFEPGVLPYLRGDSFSNGLCLRIATKESQTPDRLTMLDSLLSAKRVIHVGCCDHVPLIKHKITTNTWLHSRICRVATNCFGIDTSAEGIELMRDELGYHDVACANIVLDEIHAIDQQEWDYMLLGEILEHLDDPVGFLKSIRERYQHNVARVLITVPNAFGLLNLRLAFHHQECINTDHRHWFSPYTLGRMLVSAGMEPEELFFCEPFPADDSWHSKVRPRTAIANLLVRRYPALREGLVMIARL